MDLYITEKPSVAEALAKYFNSTGANFKKEKIVIKIQKRISLLPGRLDTCYIKILLKRIILNGKTGNLIPCP